MIDIDFTKHPKFWSKVEVRSPDECWEWQTTKRFRYGRTYFVDRQQQAHRVAWQIVFGEIPNDMKVCHKCDNTRCVNPDHLFLGTQKDNIHDMLQKGRGAVQRRSTAKLSEDAVQDIRQNYKPFSRRNGLRNFAEKYGVSTVTIFHALVRNTWKA